MDWSHLPEEQARRAEQIYQNLRQEGDSKLRELAELLATKPDEQLLGQTEFEVRDLVHEIGSGAIQTAVNQRKKATVFRVKARGPFDGRNRVVIFNATSPAPGSRAVPCG